MPDDVPFAGREAAYAAHRPDYAPAAIAYLAERFDLDPDARVLDLGCGTGQLTVPLAAHAGRVVGMDPNPEMLAQTRDRAQEAGVSNVSLVEGSDADLGPDLGTFRCVTMGRSFHWMDQSRTLDRLHDLLEPGGGVAIVTGMEWLTRADEPWAAAVHEIVTDYLDDVPERRPGPVAYDDPWDEKLRDHGFEDVGTETFADPQTWSPEDVVGYVYSLSFAGREAFGADLDVFERDVRDRLAAFDTETFHHSATTEVIAGVRPTAD